MSIAAERALEVAEGQAWLARSGNLVVITRVEDDRVHYERVAGAGGRQGRIGVYSLLGYYEQVELEEAG